MRLIYNFSYLRYHEPGAATMGLFGSLVGGILGFAVGGPIGAVAGATIGNLAQKTTVKCPHCGGDAFVEEGDLEGRCNRCRRDFPLAGGRHAQEQLRGASSAGFDRNSHGRPELTDEERGKLLFFISTFSLAAKMAKADGVVTREELAIVDNFMRNELRLESDDIEFARRIFNEARNSAESFEGFARQFAAIYSHQPKYYRTMLHILFGIAMADGVLHPAEEELLKSAAAIFGIEYQEFTQIRAMYVPDTEKHYATLGCNRSDSVETIKGRYKKLALDFHPDKIMAKDLPPEFVEFAKQKFQAIQEAYDAIRKERGF